MVYCEWMVIHGERQELIQQIWENPIKGAQCCTNPHRYVHVFGNFIFDFHIFAFTNKDEINHLHRSGATLFFKIMYPDNYYQTYHIDGDANTYENGIADAINKFVCIINKDFMEHCK